MKISYLSILLLAISTISLFLIITSPKNGKEQTDVMSTHNTYTDMAQDEAMKIFETEEDVIILDVRTKEEYEEGHIKGAVNVPNEEIASITLPYAKDDRIFVYCRSGNRSRQAAQTLVELGYTNIINFGGITTWQGEIVK